MEANPYAPPQSEILPPIATDSERIRAEHLKVEKTARTAGVLFFLISALLLIAGFGGLVSNRGQGGLGIVATIGVVGGVVVGITAFGMCRLQPWSRYLAIVISCLGLIRFPVGTLICGLILANLIGKKAQMVFSQPYKQIIAETTHVKYKTSKVSIVILVVLLLGLGAILINNFFLAGR